MNKINKIIDLLNKSHSVFHVVENMKNELLSNGFIELNESEPFILNKGSSYFVTRNDSSLIAFKIPSSIENVHFQIEASHTDSPSFKIKPNPVLNINNSISLNVEPYGGMIMSTWLDRPLSLAGRIVYQDETGNVSSKSFDIDRDLLFIPNVAIHMNREVNSGYKFNPAVDLIPLLSSSSNFVFKSFIETEARIAKDSLLSFDLFLYNRDEARVCGLNNEFLSSPRIDNLTSCYSSLLGLIESLPSSINVLAAFDNEEVGSLTRQGADSTFLESIISRISPSLGLSKDEYYQAISKSSLLSIDNAHAINPNHPEYADRTSAVLINKGIVIKYNANQSYTTDSLSSSIVKSLLLKDKLNYQEFTNRSDLRGGSTLGNISNNHLSLVSIDIGLPQLAMHSSNELCGVKDLKDMLILTKKYYDSSIIVNNSNIEIK